MLCKDKIFWRLVAIVCGLLLIGKSTFLEQFGVDSQEKIFFIAVIGFGFLLYNYYELEKQYTQQTKRLEQEIMLRRVSNSLFYNVLEADLTADRILGENTLTLARFLGLDNNSYEAMIEAIVDKFVQDDFKETYREKFSRQNILKLFAKQQTRFEYELVERSDGVNYHWIRTYVCIYTDCHTGNIKIISHVKNIQEEKERELEFINKAQLDSLTKLYNKMVTQDLIMDTLGKTSGEEVHAVYLIDLDNFKIINDSFGHAAGDLVLTQIATKLKQSFRDTDIVGRVGGDEFLVMLKNVQDLEIIAKKAEQISSICREVISKNGKRIEISLSIGICLIPLHGKSFEEIYKKADKALYRAKSIGKNSFVFYAPPEFDYVKKSC